MNRLLDRLPVRSSRARWAVVLLMAGCLLAAFAFRDHDAPEAFPPVSISTIDGRRFDSASLEGRPLLVTFWSTTCAVCLREMPEMEALYRQFSPRGFEIIAVSMPWDPPVEVVRLAWARALPYPVALDVDGSVADHYGLPGLPSTFFIDAEGVLRSQVLGPVFGDLLEAGIAAADAGGAAERPTSARPPAR